MTSAVRVLLLALGAIVIVIGGVLILRPFTSVETLVVLVVATEVAIAVTQVLGTVTRSWAHRLSAVTWLTAALVIGTQPGIALDTLAVVLGSALVVDGVVQVAHGIRATTAGQAHQLGSLLFGLTGAVLGVLLLATPEVTVTGVAVVLGARALWAGTAPMWLGVRGTFDENQPFEPGSPRRVSTALATTVALVLGVVAGTVSFSLREGNPQRLDALEIPAELPTEPGKLISAEPFEDSVPRGAEAWRILYTTTRDEGEPAVSSGLLLVARDRPRGPRPLVTWAHGTTGINTSCAPSDEPSLAFASIPGLSDALDAGWAVVTTDYTGLGTPGPHPYLIGQGEGRSVLDAARAAREFGELDLSEKTVVWGHSQGGGAALWAGILAPTYAPDLDVAGVAGIAPASDLVGLVENIIGNPFGLLFAAYVIDAYSENYPDVSFDDYITPAARDVIRRAADLCVTDRDGLVAVAQDPALRQQIYATSPTTGALAKRLKENIPDGRITAPTLIAQGEKDLLVLPNVQQEFVAQRCLQQGSGPLEYRTYSEREHSDIVAASSAMIPDLLAWTRDRFEGREAPTTC